MTREEIAYIAEEAKLPRFMAKCTQALDRFAQIVAAFEREACAQVCEEIVANESQRTALALCAAKIRDRE